MTKVKGSQSKCKKPPTKILRASNQRISKHFILWSWIRGARYSLTKRYGPQPKFRGIKLKILSPYFFNHFANSYKI